MTSAMSTVLFFSVIISVSFVLESKFMSLISFECRADGRSWAFEWQSGEETWTWTLGTGMAGKTHKTRVMLFIDKSFRYTLCINKYVINRSTSLDLFSLTKFA